MTLVSCERTEPKSGDSLDGGTIVWIDSDGNGLVVSPFDLGPKNWHEADSICKNLTIEGKSGWRLPAENELDSIYKLIHLKGLGGFNSNPEYTDYWSSTLCSSGQIIEFKFGDNGRKDCEDKFNQSGNFRAVKEFKY